MKNKHKEKSLDRNYKYDDLGLSLEFRKGEGKFLSLGFEVVVSAMYQTFLLLC